jgi:DNA topoisomerase-1
VRPTSVQRTPESLKEHLSKEQMSLYELIWKRTVSCQMIHATFDTVGADLACGDKNTFRATGSVLVNAGFMAVYQEGKDDAGKEDEERLLPPLVEGEEITLNQVLTEQHFTEPPPRFTEASLVRSLEDHGIGRPSTYAAIISTLLQREYVDLDKRRFTPTDVGRIVAKFLTEHFTQYVDYDFTANLEDELDDVARGDKEWVPLMRAFWQPFHDLIEDKDKNVQRSDVTQEKIDENCPTCGKQLSIRLGRRGRFIGCSGFPDCDYTRNLDESKEEAAAPEIIEDRVCPKCSSSLVIRNGRYGKFIGCSSYPDCNHIEPIEKPAATGVTCPQCKQGEMLQRRSRSGKTFFSCSRFPDCDYAVWNEPVNEKCPDCEWPILTVKTTKRRGTEKVCPQRECGYSEAVDDENSENEATENS